MAAGCSSEQGGGKEKVESLGLVPEHSYGIVAAATVTDAGGNECQLLKLRNPWGQGEWTGDWSDQSDKWTDELKE